MITGTTKHRGRPPKDEMQSFIFEIVEWQPEYLLSVGYGRYRLEPYNEYAEIRCSTAGVLPEKLAGRIARITIMGQENFMTPALFKRDPDWTPNCVETRISDRRWT